MGFFMRGSLAAFAFVFIFSSAALPQKIDYQSLAYIESSNNPAAVSNKNAVGLYQITQPCLDDYNLHNKTNYTLSDLLADPVLNKAVAAYYLEVLIPRYLKNMNKPVTVSNRLHAYHDGPGNVKKGYMSDYCKLYICKYWCVYFINLLRGA